MGGFVKGDVVIVPFPFSNLLSSKRRPALVIAVPMSDDLILAQITSQSFSDAYAIAISDDDFSEGGLRIDSNVRVNKLFTAEPSLIAYKAGSLNPKKIKNIADEIIKMVSV